ncbi:amino acid ABC transporter permease [Demequina muriae]|uniref:Amino acid ABC transporter permease n=1 Tax=Demequina muriae TaxID=3051664 RepID=A0ABT8GDS4_9MICO|nr:amino acid ABC transporter permease [Demequina sp. EGI L300058]MDN4479576.1 amino acid ABC transporter permease [Demequina sp. EGI L300058]
MGALFDNLDVVAKAFGNTLWISVVAGILSFVWGVVLAAFRVSPVGPLRAFGTAYVNVIRNTPLTLVFIFFLAASPQLMGLVVPLGATMAIIAMTLYTSTFVCEAVRSGVNSVGVGQAEAARSVGLTFIQTLTHVIMPQAFRSVMPPLINVYVAHIKNTSVAAGFATTELVAIANRLANGNPGDVVGIFFGIGLAFLVLTVPLSVAAERLESRVAVAR